MTGEITGDMMTKLSNLRILVVDDNAYARSMASGLIRKMGVSRCVEAASGSDAVSLLAKERFDILITDWYMPDINGAGLIKIVRDDRFVTNRGLPVIVMTGYASTENLARAKALDVGDILLKPLDLSGLETAIARAASKRTVRFDEAEAEEDFFTI